MTCAAPTPGVHSNDRFLCVFQAQRELELEQRRQQARRDAIKRRREEQKRAHELRERVALLLRRRGHQHAQ